MLVPVVRVGVSMAKSNGDHVVVSKPKIVKRSFNFCLDGVDSVWIPGDHFASLVMNVCHLLLPQAELWICRTFNKTLPLITDELFLQEVKGFIGQEGAHAQGHATAMTYFENLGWEFSVNRDALDSLFDGWLGDKVAGVLPVSGRLKRYWLIIRIGMIAIIEHVTSVLGVWMIENVELEKTGADKQMMALLKWHGAEEVEHRAMAHDLYLHLGGSRLISILMCVPGVIIVLLLWRGGTRVINQQENGDTFKYGIKTYRESSRRGHLPTARYLIVNLMRYLRWGFHPEQLGSTAKAKQILNGLESYWEYDRRS